MTAKKKFNKNIVINTFFEKFLDKNKEKLQFIKDKY